MPALSCWQRSACRPGAPPRREVPLKHPLRRESAIPFERALRTSVQGDPDDRASAVAAMGWGILREKGIVPAEATRRRRPGSSRWQMNGSRIAGAMIGWSLCLSALPASAQTNLPGITVTAPYTSTHGGYLMSGDFKVDPRMPQVVFPAQALVKDDILSVQPIHLADDEYLV